MLRVSLRVRQGEFTLDAAFDAPAASVLVLVGESGAGKTTLLRAVAGLVTPEAGTITCGDRTITDTSRGVRVPPQARRVGYLPQEYALFPHLTVIDNVEFGLRASGVPAAERQARARAALARLGVAELAERRPASLSGGQQQRVALARALALEPEILLLDEPLAALDRRTRAAVRASLRGLLAELGAITLFVTHSPTEGLAFGDRFAVLEAGRITQLGTRDELLRTPRTAYVAEFLGTNLLRAVVRSRAAAGLATLEADGAPLTAPVGDLEGELFAVVDPREITLSRSAPAGSARNVLTGAILDLLPEPPAGERVRVSLGTRPPLVAEVTRAAVETLGLKRGETVVASFKATGVRVFQ